MNAMNAAPKAEISAHAIEPTQRSERNWVSTGSSERAAGHRQSCKSCSTASPVGPQSPMVATAAGAGYKTRAKRPRRAISRLNADTAASPPTEGDVER